VGTGRTAPLPLIKGGEIPEGRATLLLLENRGTKTEPVFIPRPLTLPDGSLIDLGSHSCAPTVGDIDGDGLPEVITGEETGRIFFFDNGWLKV
jgi:hypothetical protein